ncbi:pentatricopeptide repeat-containing protein At1g71420 [Quercus suber]|uniref:pentatricopeptide repeat-containing protein At1g71420 n=1 Tax=Quercus suber TaxID=58331 RepID=UPI000CE1D9D7|nr:pentatricopeptide repeat-containing protein At1g71420 [Quercus suber]
MPRPTTRACYFSLRQLHIANVPTASSYNTEPNNLLNQVRVLSNRGHLQEALSIFYTQTQTQNHQTYATLFHACARHRSLHEGISLHYHMLSHNPTNPFDLFVTNHLINMYCKFGYVDYAHRLFDEMPHRNLVSWTALISGYAQQGRAGECFLLFSSMLVEYYPNEFAVASVLSSCFGERGRQVHALALKLALDSCVYVANALITMYSKSTSFGCVYNDDKDEAWSLFKTMQIRNLVSWNSMVAGFQIRGLGTQAMNLFTQMHREGTGFDRATLLSVFSSLYGSESSGNIQVDDVMSSSLKFCLQLHCLTIKTGLISEIEITTALVKSYFDIGGDIGNCYRIFMETSTSHRDIVSWTSIITALAERDPEEALFLFCQLRREDLIPDWYTFSIALKACAGLVTERHAMAVHSQVIKAGFEGDTVLANALIHAYARCGNIALTKQVFDEMEFRDLVSWNSMLKAHALHGKAREALQLFWQMNLQPDPTTFVALLSACSHAELVDEGIIIFDSMVGKYGIVPQLDHYACMVDIVGRSGRVLEAAELINRMPMKPDSVVWSTLLGSCRKHGKTSLAKLAADKLKELEPGNSLGYVQMSNIYSSGGNFNKAGLIRNEMKGSSVRKEPGLSWVEIGNQVHEFASGGRCHPERGVIFRQLEGFIGKLKEIGYVPETSLALHDMEEEQKEEQLYCHSEKLALTFAVMNERSLCYGGRVIRINKNIRICVDCHNFMKLASDMLKKEIVVRDANRFHHFKGGVCSCNDYW